jgi:uncharacterized protein
MQITDLFGYFGALVIGISLGLIGGGGSILAVPVLAYLFYIDEKTATAYSLFIVGISSLASGIKQYFKGFVNLKIGVLFGIPAIIGVATVRKFVVPVLPEVLFTINNFEFSRRMGMFGLFALLMIPAAISMLKEKKEPINLNNNKKYNYTLIVIEGIVVGTITGLIGAGGGFIIIPALVLLTNLDMKTAIGTSLIIIALKSLFGFFLGDAFSIKINWDFLYVFTSISLLGSLIGSFLSNYINGKKLKKVFGYFIFLMAFFIFYMEFFVKR